MLPWIYDFLNIGRATLVPHAHIVRPKERLLNDILVMHGETRRQVKLLRGAEPPKSRLIWLALLVATIRSLTTATFEHCLIAMPAWSLAFLTSQHVQPTCFFWQVVVNLIIVIVLNAVIIVWIY